MKTGLILYVPQHHRRLDDFAIAQVIDLAPDLIRLATSDEEMAYQWWSLLARGMRKVECVVAEWDGVRQAWSPQCQPLRLCG